MDILTILVVGTLNIACFLIGAKVGQMVSRGEEIKIESPAEKRIERQEKKANRTEQDRINAILRNVERYDGTSAGQEDVPRG